MPVNWSDWAPKDPADRFKELTSQLAPAVGTTSPDELQQAVKDALDTTAATPDQQPAEVAKAVAARTRLTTAEAAPIVAQALTAAPAADTDTKAKAVTNAVSALSGGVPSLSLSDPVMLGSPARTAFAGVSAVALIFGILGIIFLAAFTNSGAAPYNVLAVLAGLSLLAVVVFVMGYKNVSISSGSAASKSGKSGSTT
jgi:hypothetical protein